MLSIFSSSSCQNRKNIKQTIWNKLLTNSFSMQTSVMPVKVHVVQIEIMYNKFWNLKSNLSRHAKELFKFLTYTWDNWKSMRNVHICMVGYLMSLFRRNQIWRKYVLTEFHIINFIWKNSLKQNFFEMNIYFDGLKPLT